MNNKFHDLYSDVKKEPKLENKNEFYDINCNPNIMSSNQLMSEKTEQYCRQEDYEEKSQKDSKKEDKHLIISCKPTVDNSFDET